MAEIYLLRFGGQLAGQHTVAATPGGRPHGTRARPPRALAATHPRTCQLLRYRIGAYGRGAIAIVLSSFDQPWLLLPAILGLGTASS